jgi:hypothetical protein
MSPGIRRLNTATAVALVLAAPPRLLPAAEQTLTVRDNIGRAW